MSYEYTRQNNLWEDSCKLIKRAVTFDENGVRHSTIVSERECYCTVGSIYQKEFYEADAKGVNLQWKVFVSAADYDGELEVVLTGSRYGRDRYAVYRKYYDGDKVELYLRDDAGTLDGGSNA